MVQEYRGGKRQFGWQANAIGLRALPRLRRPTANRAKHYNDRAGSWRPAITCVSRAGHPSGSSRRGVPCIARGRKGHSVMESRPMAEDEETEKFLRFCACHSPSSSDQWPRMSGRSSCNFEENCTWLGCSGPTPTEKDRRILEQAADLVAAAQQPIKEPGRTRSGHPVCPSHRPSHDVIAAENIMEAGSSMGSAAVSSSWVPTGIGRSCSSA
jgi:hypothetical protein